jgi:hypothetical protein
MTREFPKNNPPEITRPTVGRIVLVYVRSVDTQLAAIVTKVVGLYEINACVFNEDGSSGPLQNIPHTSERAANASLWWDWMDYQKGQAAKAEELEAKLKEASPSKE